MTPPRHGTRGRNMSKGESLDDQRVRTTAEVEFDNFLEEIVYPAIGQHRYGRLLDLADKCSQAHYGRGYMRGRRDERTW